VAYIADEGECLAARSLDLLGGGEHGALQSGVRHRGLGEQYDVRAVPRGAQPDRQPYPATPAGHHDRPACQRPCHDLSLHGARHKPYVVLMICCTYDSLAATPG